MKYIGMPLGIWLFFKKSFQRNLIAVFELTPTEAQAVMVESKEKYKEIIRHPSIIHYLGEERPWVHGNFSPYRKVYDSYKVQTPWKDTPMIYGKEKVLFCYHILNLITAAFPWFRRLFTKCIGIRYYQFAKKD